MHQVPTANAGNAGDSAATLTHPRSPVPDRRRRLRTVRLLGVLTLTLWIGSCATSRIVGDEGYDWPSTTRTYWPTKGWKSAPMSACGIDPARMAEADAFAHRDPLTRCLLVVRGGRIAFEQYYGNGGRDRSTEVWSVTKSFTSALVGIAIDKGFLNGPDDLMVDHLPEYPAFRDIRLGHVLTHTTGLRFSEEGISWTRWVWSPDWTAEALGRPRDHRAGEHFHYSSANSHFLSDLIRQTTGQTPGAFARRYLFGPLGIRLDPLPDNLRYTRWDDYKIPVPRCWRQDPRGTEIGGFGLHLTAREMAKFGFLFLNRGRWDGRTVISESWVKASTRDHVTGIRRYSYGYQWWVARVDGTPCFLASGLGGQIIAVVPSRDLVVVIKYESEHPQLHADAVHDDMKLLELAVRAARGSA
jgi:CubicO group peptidase (beta-lactamase class C family)